MSLSSNIYTINITFNH